MAVDTQPDVVPAVIRFGELAIYPVTQRVKLGEATIELSRMEYRLLSVLSSRAGRIVTRTELLHEVWGEGWFGDDHVVDVHISNLRRKLGDEATNPRFIGTVRGRGFTMKGRPIAVDSDRLNR